VTGGGTTGGGATGGGVTGGGVTGGGVTGGGATGGGGGSALLPNVMFLIDFSCSMSLPADPLASGCPSSCGTPSNPCPTTCPTRLSELRAGMRTFLTTRGTSARFGLTTFPGGNLCQAPTRISVPLPPPMTSDVGNELARQQKADAIVTELGLLGVQGGTPTALALGYVRGDPSLNADDGRKDLVVLITDGLPNCNDANPNAVCACGTSCTPAQLSACACTTSTCTAMLTCSNGCLDRDATVAAVAALRAQGIDTLVIALGPDAATPTAAAVLDEMAREGGRVRTCPNGTSAECGGLMCRGDRTCAEAHYTVNSAGMLSDVLVAAVN
jgi:hypothetical protein